MNEPLVIASSARTAALCLAVPGARYFLPSKTAWRLTSPDGGERRGETATVVTLLHDLSPDTCYVFEAEGFGRLEFRTAPCAGLVEAAGFSLMPDVALDDEEGARANAQALERAVAAVPHGGTLRLLAGLWTAFPVRLKSNMTFHLAEGAVLRAPSTRRGWPILPARDEAGRMLGSWEGLPDACFAAMA